MLATPQTNRPIIRIRTYSPVSTHPPRRQSTCGSEEITSKRRLPNHRAQPPVFTDGRESKFEIRCIRSVRRHTKTEHISSRRDDLSIHQAGKHRVPPDLDSRSRAHFRPTTRASGSPANPSTMSAVRVTHIGAGLRTASTRVSRNVDGEGDRICNSTSGEIVVGDPRGPSTAQQWLRP